MATPVSLHGTLIILMKDISEGLQLDSADRYQDAYRKYLECLLRITTTLLKKLHNDGGHLNISSDLCKTVKLGQQCMDRVSAIVSEKYVPSSEKRKSASTNMALPLTSPTTPTSMTIPTTGTPGSASPRGLGSTRQSGSSTPSPSLERSVRYNYSASASGQSRKDKAVSKSRSAEQLKPMAVAAQQNKQLLQAFKARQAQAQRRKDHSMSTNLSLTLQRKMAENLAIAKAQEEALAKKMLERQVRLEEQAARRFGTPVGLSAEEQHQRQIYRRVLQFELEQPEIKDVKTRFEENPTDFELISELLLAVLGCDNHPLTEQLKQYQNKVLNKLQPMVCDNLADLEDIKVPLGTYLYGKWKIKMKQQSNNKENNNEPGDDSNEESLTVSDSDSKDNQDANENDKSEEESHVTAEDNDNTRSNDSSLESGPDIVTVVESNKKDIETAMVRGEKLKKKLDNENESLKSLALYTAGEYDKYNQENMDDLFDDDEEDGNNDNDEVASNSGTDNSMSDRGTNNSMSDSKSETTIGSVDIDDETIKAYRRHLKGIVEDIVQSVDQLAVLFVVVYDKLDSAEGRDQCNAKLEASFFKPLWKYLLALFRLSNSSEELQLAGIMTSRQGCGPESFSVRDRLCLTPGSTSQTSRGYPYEAAVRELQGVVRHHTMLEKLECIVRTSKLVMQCVEQFYTDQNMEAPSLGADDLVPLLCYVVVRSGLPQIVSECQAVERFLHEGYMFGEEGYCLTSFQTAIDYLTSEKYQGGDV